MNRKLLTILIPCLLAGSLLGAFGRSIKGSVVSSEDNLPLIGASVYVLSDDLKKINYTQTSLGTVTDLDGNFTLNVPENITRIFCSYLGFKNQEITLTAGDTCSISLQSSDIVLKDFVVTGYQQVERRKLTAAISKIEISDETVGAIHSVDQALAGKIAGLSSVTTTGAPGAPVKIRIRGTASLNGTQDPLWVLDGLPLEGSEIPKMEDLIDIDNIYTSSVAGINPSDIESITVLKDAAATAIYGARAANGVIVITTKSGRKGKTRVNFSSRLSYSPNINIDRLNLLSSQEKVGLESDLLQSDYTFRETKGGVAGIISSHGETSAYKSGGWDALSPGTQDEINRLRTINTDWNDILFRDVFGQEYNLSLSGGNDTANYYSSTGYFDEQGNIPGVSMNRFNITGKVTYKLNEAIKFGASIFANQRKNNSFLSNYNGFTNPVRYARWANPYQQAYDENGQYIYDRNIQGRGDESLDFNVFEERNNTSYKKKTQSLSSIFDLELRFSNQLKFTSQVGLQYDNNLSERIADHDTYLMRYDRYRSIVQIGGVSQSFLPKGGKNTIDSDNTSQVTGKFMGEYRNSWRNIHELEVMVGSELRKNRYERISSTAYGFDRKTLTTQPVIYPDESYVRYFPQFGKDEIENAYVSWFSTFSYSFKRKYTLGGSIRFDGSNLFGVDKKYRYLPLYSVSGLWRLSEENFLKDISWLDNLLIRTSYGLQGNIDKSTSPFILGRYSEIAILPGTPEQTIVIESPPNSKLRWEKTHSFNAGFEASALNEAINLSVDYYYRYGADLIAPQSLPLESGFYTTMHNWASIKNQGVEISITSRNIHTQTFSWFTNFNIAYNNNKVLKDNIPENATTPSREGYPVGAIFGYKSGGLDDEGYPLYITRSGEKLNAKDYFHLSLAGPDVKTDLSAKEQRDLYYYFGTSEPPVSGGLTNTFRLKAFELAINCIFNLGQYVQVQPSYSPTSYDRGLNSNRDILSRWTPGNQQTVFPVLMTENKRLEEFRGYSYYSYDRSLDLWIKKNDYMRVQSIRLGYDLPESFMRIFHIHSGVVALEARNLFVIASNYKNFLDPETMGNPSAQPVPKTIIFSLNLNF
ncbi:MAG: SusC/RagA family TonB-linked outer membrane protein [Dysgonamonadaceae bacterium]|nr:SusC/RagA family TonB-linked outer membrane protein [Dysgonamonadaceae bacterium]